MALFTSRKPIFSKKMDVIAYELIYRDNTEICSSPVKCMTQPAKREEVKSLMISEYKNISGRKKSYIFFDEIAVIFEIPLSFDPATLVVEISGKIDIDDEDILHRLEILKERGYTVSLDNADKSTSNVLLELANMVKVDYSKHSPEELKSVLEFLKPFNVKTIAVNLQNEADFKIAKELEFNYFEGCFYTVPAMSKNKELDVISNTYLRLINEWNKEAPDNRILSDIVVSDVSLSFKLLKLLNSAAFYRQTKITSVHTAIVTLGDVAFKKWLLLLMLNDVNQTKSDELVVSSILRAKLMEVIWENLGIKAHTTDSAFMTGVFSMLDIIMARDKSDILYDLPVLQDVKDAIILRQNGLGKLLELIEHIERGDVEEIEIWCSKYGYPRKNIIRDYLESTTWLNLLMEIEGR